jgi:hypothetical protein
MKWGKLYGPEYVNRLYNMVKRNLTIPHRFVCFTDDATGIDSGVETFPMPEIPLPESHKNLPWRKIGLFSPKLADLEGQALFLDLDLVIVGNIDCFFAYEGDFCIIHNWTHPDRIVGNSSVYRFEVGADSYVYDTIVNDMQGQLAKYRNSQTFLSHTVKKLTYWPDEWCKSFKKHCVPKGILRYINTPKIPAGAKIVVFHGDPNPDAALVGKWPGFGLCGLHKKVKPTKWIANYWK